MATASFFLHSKGLYTARARAHPPPPPRSGRAPGSNAPGGPRRRKQGRGPHRSRRQPTPLPRLRCGTRLARRASPPRLFFVVEGVYTQEERAHLDATTEKPVRPRTYGMPHWELGVALTGSCTGSCTGERELPEASFFLGKRQGDSEAQGNYRRAQGRANAPLFQSTEQLAN
jgi:hypothetical protein